MTGEILIVPGTGEIIDLATVPKDDLIRYRGEIADLSARLAAAKTLLNAEIMRRIDDENATAGSGWTWRTPRYEITVDSPGIAGKRHDEAMRAELIAEHRDIEVDALFTRTVTYTLKLDRWRNLVKRRPDLDEIRERHTSPPQRRVTIRPLAITATADELP